MPSEKILKEKEAFVASLREKMEGSVAGVIVDYKGINVADDTKLRKELREAGVEYFVVKNTMLRLAVKETGLAGLAEVLKGSTALAVSKEDPTAAARILNKFAEASKGKFSLKSGYMEGKVLDEAELTAIAKLPDYKGMLSMVCRRAHQHAQRPCRCHAGLCGQAGGACCLSLSAANSVKHINNKPNWRYYHGF